MQIHKIIEQNGTFKRYADKYTKPLYRYRDHIPKNILKKFYAQADIEEVATYYFGVRDPFRRGSFVAFLSHLEREYNFKIPVTNGIMTADFWRQWMLNNLVRIIEQGRLFGI